MTFRVLTAAFVSLLASATSFAQVNIAPAGDASQSTDWTDNSAPRAIDGNRDPLWGGGSIAHTGTGMDQWWQVDFSEQAYSMSEIRIYPRTDCCTTRNSNMRVSVFLGDTEVWGQDLYTTSGELDHAGEVLPLPLGTVGDRVRLQFLGLNLAGDGYMMLAEVEIDGEMAAFTPHCDPAVPNSSGVPAELIAVGTNQVGGQPFGLIASQMPSNQFGYFLVGNGTGMVTPAGSMGPLCILGTKLGRFNAPGQIQMTQFRGDTFGLVIDTNRLPLNPSTAVMAGETWYFQAWFRENSGSNFTNAVGVTFN